MLRMFHSDVGRFPTTSEGLIALVNNPGLKGYSKDGYLSELPIDPWGNTYKYLCPGTSGRYYDLESFGKDGEDGGTDDNADIEHWNLNS